MSSYIDCSIVVLTHNEEANIVFLLESVCKWAKEIFIVDSGSGDATLEIASRFDAKIYHNPWKTYADQFNWALDNLPIKTEWVMRMDADEYVTEELAEEICLKLPKSPPSVNGYYLKRRVYFMGRWIKHGSYYPTWLLRIFRNGRARCETLWMDEHIVLFNGLADRLDKDIVDENHKGLSFWTIKHEKYAQREMMDLLSNDNEGDDKLKPEFFGEQDKRKRWLKSNLYARSPLFLRVFAYFIYRYFFRLGFLDGIEGLIFHVLQGFWYRFYVDAKICEATRRNAKTHQSDSIKDN